MVNTVNITCQQQHSYCEQIAMIALALSSYNTVSLDVTSGLRLSTEDKLVVRFHIRSDTFPGGKRPNAALEK